MSGDLFEGIVGRKAVAALDIVELDLLPPGGGALPAFSAGAHIDVEVRPGLLRQYSLCNDPAETHRYQIGVLREPNSRGGSIAVHDALREGQRIRIGAPRNRFPLVPAQRSLLFAGGIGITPLLSMAEQLARDAAAFEMHYCTRSPSRTAFAARIAASAFAGRVCIHHDDGPPAQRLDLHCVLPAPHVQTHLYVCGPRGFIDWVCGTARASGWAPAQIHVEHFAGDGPQPDGQSFEVRLARSGATLPVPAGRSVAAVLHDHGIDLPVSCEQGVCGTCLTRVLAGEPEHRDSYLTDEERCRNDQFLPCCSRSRSACLVLDL
ncbi:PDR/VanB family oxidoreductase [Piscinibacter sp.]|uniref:PDR/VanB family oxidoreductase n=1 Tax=Piscinibacter sp. TaxID=1903157 RepID=UPI002C299F2E|nr:PDR/VanB family oxidoreductase [Albitalea sp.]HUG22174.1 PDR/VanB family oxidoreductase [Albitalea sp.]